MKTTIIWSCAAILAIGGGFLIFKPSTATLNFVNSQQKKEENFSLKQVNDKNDRAVVVGQSIATPAILLSQQKEENAKHEADYDSFARCLKDKGAMFYGASWCSHCQHQKAAFGDSAKFLPYVECAGENNIKTKACSEAQITAYPTWKFADGTIQLGGMSMPDLAQKTGCVLPEATT